MQEIKTIDDLILAVEDAAEAKIFEHVWLASEQAKQEAFAKGLPIVVLEGNQIVEIAPDGKKRLIQTLDIEPRKETDKKINEPAIFEKALENIKVQQMRLSIFQILNSTEDRNLLETYLSLLKTLLKSRQGQVLGYDMKGNEITAGELEL